MKTLKQARRSKKLTITQLSEKTGITRANISLIENNLSKPNDATIKKLEKILGNLDFSKIVEKYKIKTLTIEEAKILLDKFTTCLLGLSDENRQIMIKQTRKQMETFK